MSLKPTQDPHVFIEAQEDGYVRYRQIDPEQAPALNPVRRWEVYGHCVGLAHCIIGAVIDGEEVKTLDGAKEIWQQRGERFILDDPITPEFHGCCPFTFNELEV